ncbi:hypothetical protein C0J52_25999 [Blattella germanica]|nr:hypothetical protein C0J52_25999 [Blattella germanica]
MRNGTFTRYLCCNSDFFVSQQRDVLFFPVVTIMAGLSGLREEEIVALLENDDILSDFSFCESDSENIEDSASDSSGSNSDITDVDDVGLPTQPAYVSE